MEKKTPSALDSLLGADSIMAIYSSNDMPPIITDDAVEEENEPPRILHRDSTNSWTDDPTLIAKIKTLFPALHAPYRGIIESTCCGHRELFIKTSGKDIFISWNVHTSDSAAMVNGTPCRSDKKALGRIIVLLNRPIVRREILLADSVSFSLSNDYNRHYSTNWPKSKFIYVLK